MGNRSVIKKGIILLFFVFLLLGLTSCSEDKSEVSNNQSPAVDTEKTPEETEIVDNTKSAVIDTVDKVIGNEVVDQEAIDRENAIEVAKGFVKGTYSLYDRKDENDIGGFEYAHPGLRESLRPVVEEWQKNYFANFEREMLPEVLSMTVRNVERTTFNGYDGNTYPYYIVYVVVEFNKNRDYWEENVVPIGVIYRNNVWEVEAKENSITLDQLANSR